MPQINICVWHEIGNEVQYFLYGYPVVLAPFGEKVFFTQWVSLTFNVIIYIVGFQVYYFTFGFPFLFSFVYLSNF